MTVHSYNYNYNQDLLTAQVNKTKKTCIYVTFLQRFILKQKNPQEITSLSCTRKCHSLAVLINRRNTLNVQWISSCHSRILPHSIYCFNSFQIRNKYQQWMKWQKVSHHSTIIWFYHFMINWKYNFKTSFPVFYFHATWSGCACPDFFQSN